MNSGTPPKTIHTLSHKLNTRKENKDNRKNIPAISLIPIKIQVEYYIYT